MHNPRLLSGRLTTLPHYSETEHVLKNLTLSIEAGQKIGICGRTGRLVNANIFIDGWANICHFSTIC